MVDELESQYEAYYEAYIEELITDKTKKLNKVKNDTLEKYSIKLKQIKEDSIHMSYEFFRDLYNEILFKKKEFERIIDLEIELLEQYERDKQDTAIKDKYNLIKRDRENLII